MPGLRQKSQTLFVRPNIRFSNKQTFWFGSAGTVQVGAQRPIWVLDQCLYCRSSHLCVSDWRPQSNQQMTMQPKPDILRPIFDCWCRLAFWGKDFRWNYTQAVPQSRWSIVKGQHTITSMLSAFSMPISKTTLVSHVQQMCLRSQSVAMR